MKQIYYSLLFVVVFMNTSIVFSQTSPNWRWAKQPVCTGSWEDVKGVKIGVRGDVYAAGRYGTNMTLAPLPAISGLGGTPIYVAKMRNDGTPVWLKSVYSTGGNDYAYGVNIDNFDNTYVAICANSGSAGAHVVKVDSLGNVVWRGFGVGSGTGAYGVAAAPNGDVYMCGDLQGTLNFSSTASTTTLTLTSTLGNRDIFLVKYNSAGVIQWVRNAGGSQLDIARSLVCDASGNVYMSGSYEGTAAFGTITPPTATPGIANLFIAKYDPAGNTQWVRTAAGAGIPSHRGFSFWRFNQLTIDDCENLYITGEFVGTANFGGTGLTSAGVADMFVAKLNTSSGVWEWATKGGGTGEDMGLGIAVDDEHSVYVSGQFFSATANFNNISITATSTNNFFAAKYSTSGCDTCLGGVQLQWVKTTTSSGAGDYGGGIAIDNLKRTYVGGGFTGTGRYGTSTFTSTGTGDIFLASLDSIPLNEIKLNVAPDYCAGNTYTIPHFAYGTFNPGNIFTVYLSGIGGNFASSTIIGNTASSSSGNVTITIPSGIAPGRYRLKMVSSSPIMESIDCDWIDILPTPQINLSSTGGCAGASIQSGLPQTGYSFIWSNGATTANISSLTTSGVYTVTVTSASGCSSVDSLSITAAPPLSVSIQTNSVSCFGDSTGSINLITGGGTPAYTYSWSNGANTAVLNNVPSGSYTFVLTDANGCTEAGVIGITQPLAPLSITTQTTAVTCNGISNGVATILVTQGGTPNYNYQWSNGSSSSTVAGLPAGIYTLTVSDNNNCKDVSTITITQPNSLTASVISTPVTCTLSTGQVAIQASGGVPAYTYQWNGGQTTSIISGLASGTYTCVISDANNCSIVVSPTVNIAPTNISVSINPALPSTICAGQSTTLNAVTAGGTAPYLYNWSNSQNTASVVLSPTTTTTYSIMITDASGCSAEASTTVNVNPLPEIDFSEDKTNGCGPLCVNFTNNTPNTATAQWNFGDGNSSTANSPENCYTQPNSYTVILTVTDNNGCSNTLTKNSHITVHPNPTADFTTDPTNGVVKALETINFYEKSTNATSWNWELSTIGLFSNSQNTSYVFEDTGSFAVRLIVTNEFGCSDSIVKTVRVIDDYQIFVPNSFTPNGDGKNDVFNPSLTGVDSDAYEFWIYDRWGNLIFKTSNPYQGWDGRANGGSDIAQQDTYVWKVSLRNNFNESKNYVGHVNLIR